MMVWLSKNKKKTQNQDWVRKKFCIGMGQKNDEKLRLYSTMLGKIGRLSLKIKTHN